MYFWQRCGEVNLINEVCQQLDANCSFDSSSGTSTESNLSHNQNCRKRKNDEIVDEGLKKLSSLIDEANMNSLRATINQIKQSIKTEKDKVFELTFKLLDAPVVSALTIVLQKRKDELEKGINEMEEEVIKLEKKVDSSEKNN